MGFDKKVATNALEMVCWKFDKALDYLTEQSVSESMEEAKEASAAVAVRSLVGKSLRERLSDKVYD